MIEEALPQNIDVDVILSALVEGTSDGITRVDENGIVVSWSPGVERMLGYERDEVVGQPIDKVIPVELREQVKNNIRDQLSGKIGVVHEETVRVHKNGKLIPVLLTRIPLKNTEGKTVALLAIVKDISEQKKLQKQVETLQRNNAMAKVAAKVAHEIRTPLGVLFLKSDLLIEKLEQAFECWGNGYPDKQKKSLEKCVYDIQRQISRLEEIANNYLHLSKIRSMERQDVEIKRFIEDTIAELREQYESYSIQFHCAVDDRIDTAYIDPQQFQRVFANLVRNSVEAIQQSHIKNGIVSIRADWIDADTLEFLVVDNGPGMPEEIRQTIFDPFTTTKSIGTGLGMYLACEIVENHKGTISIDSEPGKGTTVHIRIPVQEREA